MIVLDEQMREDQRRILADWRIPFRQIGRELAVSGIQDENIIPFLLTLKRPTFFTHDQGFFKAQLCHPGYCLVWLDVSDIEAGYYIRRFLRQRAVNTHAKRMGMVARVHRDGLHFWRRQRASVSQISWKEK